MLTLNYLVSSAVLQALLWQAETPTPSPHKEDPGNYPMGTAVLYVIFMLVLVGGGVASFRIRMFLIQKSKERAKNRSEIIASPNEIRKG